MDEKAKRKPRNGEVAVHCKTFAGVVKRSKINELQFVEKAIVARNTVRSCLGLDGKGPIANVTEDSFAKLLKYLRAVLGEPLTGKEFLCELDTDLTDEADFRVRIRRELAVCGPYRHLIAAVAHHPRRNIFLAKLKNAADLWSALTNQIWRRHAPDAFWVCSYREASAYISYLRGKGEDESAFYMQGKAGEVKMHISAFLAELGWHNVHPALYSSEELIKLAEQLALFRREGERALDD